MAHEIFDDRRKALEDEFFKKNDQAILDRLKAEAKRTSAKESIAAASGIRDDAVLARIVDVGFDASTLLAFGLAPAVEVAWADGAVDEAERQHILKHLSASGFPRDSAAYAMVESWMARRPSKDLFDAWVEYTRALCKTLKPEDREWLASTILSRSTEVANASGGILGLALKRSKAEAEVLRRVEAAFAG